ncbi:MAG: nitronate monooxygenase [Deltaproteobacteria bacterium]|nr:nitronate monooxygenase [Deltaproteobacteria bacterium]
MLKSELCDFLEVKHPIIQAGMGPFSNNKLCIATANAGVLGLLSTSGITSETRSREFLNHLPKQAARTLMMTMKQF